ncbi:DUF4810 domain-containing protein [Pseudoalteromonas luteoviolacea]|uniref:DUF4810 domain-containing protein n=1 Tax=Pseudoalteromonas luteoviolacea TaxID=43657 RepID=UPI001F1D2F35|nr:DUF4810 domain-containing protein [Pseudoalteromonas luteoviolacea]MCF6438724.1 DUF4810 domain-containing protein [Pseudoalteromonas luteoviolacea]
MKKLLIAVAAAAALTGCKTKEPLFYHGEYSEVVYNYFKADEKDISEQISSLEQIIQQASGKSKPVAPGVHAHLGMLYFESGNSELGVQHFETEKSLFPESAQYIDFLLNSAKGS